MAYLLSTVKFEIFPNPAQNHLVFSTGQSVEKHQEKENTQTTVISYAPNPATNELFIKSTTNINGNISIINNLGEVVLESQIQGAFQQLNISALSNGIYFLHLSQENGIIYTAKFLKQ